MNDKPKGANTGNVKRDEAHARRDERQAGKVYTFTDPNAGGITRQVTIVSKDQGSRLVRDVATGEEFTVSADYLSRDDDSEEGTA
jgi:hypothetical protein